MARIVVMGVSGCGKTSFGEALAAVLAWPFVEGDALHPPTNIGKMSAGIPLNDDDRWPWLDLVGNAIGRSDEVIVSCSALKRVYRDRLRSAARNDLAFVCLNPPRELLEQRLRARKGHFMPATLLASQLAALELPRNEHDAVILDATGPMDAAVRRTVVWLEGRQGSRTNDSR